MATKKQIDRFKELCGLDKRYKEISKQWTTGGLTGGNCWDGDASTPISAEPEPEFVELDEVLEKVCPTISFLQYKKLCQSLIQTDDTLVSYEYYGNYTTDTKKSIEIDKLVDYLISKNLWDPEKE